MAVHEELRAEIGWDRAPMEDDASSDAGSDGTLMEGDGMEFGWSEEAIAELAANTSVITSTTRGMAIPFSQMRRGQYSYMIRDRSYSRWSRFNGKRMRNCRGMTPSSMLEVIHPPRKELRLQAKKGSKNKNYPKKPMRKDRRRGMSRQGQDFGCSKR